VKIRLIWIPLLCSGLFACPGGSPPADSTTTTIPSDPPAEPKPPEDPVLTVEARKYYQLWDELKERKFEHSPNELFQANWEDALNQANTIVTWNALRHLESALKASDRGCSVFPWRGLDQDDARKTIALARSVPIPQVPKPGVFGDAIYAWRERLKQPNRQGIAGRSMVAKANFDEWWTRYALPLLERAAKWDGIGGATTEKCGA